MINSTRHFIMLSLALTAGCVGAESLADKGNSDIVYEAGLLSYFDGFSQRDALNPGNIAARPKRTEDTVGLLGLKFNYGELLARFSETRSDIDGQISSKSNSKLLRGYTKIQYGDDLSFTLGKKNLHLDSGYAFRAFDFFEDLTIATDFDDWRGREEGFPLASLSYTNQEATWRAVYADDSQSKELGTNRGFKQLMLAVDVISANWNFTFLAQKYNIGHAGFGAGGSFTPSAKLALHSTLLLRQGNISQLHRGVLSDAPTVSAPDSDPIGRWRTYDDKWFSRFVIGGQYTNDTNVNLLAEYFYDGSGLNDKEWKNYLRMVSLHQALPNTPLRAFNLAADSRSLATRRQHYLFLRISFNESLFQPEFSVLGGHDGSSQLRVKLHHKLTDNMLGWLDFSANMGPSSSEFAMLPIRNRMSGGFRLNF